jgi:DNA mismatch repair protein MutS2
VLELGKPGSSYAFEIAQNIGLQKEVLELARAKTGTNQNRIDSLLVDLEREKKQIYDTKLHLSTQQNKVKNLVAENEKLKLFLDENKKVLLKEAKLEAQAIIKNANKLVENTIAEIKETQADKTVTKQLRQNLQKVLVQNQVKEEKKPEVAVPLNTPIEVGDWVQLNNSETTGQVLEINRDNLVVALGDLRSVLKKNRVYKISNKQAKKAIQNNSYTGSISEAIGNFTAELDLRGMRGDNALHEVEKYLDKSIMLGFPFIKLIHGKGDGILRKLIREYLKKYSQVNRVEDEHADRGGDGITYVYFN